MIVIFTILPINHISVVNIMFNKFIITIIKFLHYLDNDEDINEDD